MADLKITALSAIAVANMHVNDRLYYVDVSAGTAGSKQVYIGDLYTFMVGGVTPDTAGRFFGVPKDSSGVAAYLTVAEAKTLLGLGTLSEKNNPLTTSGDMLYLGPGAPPSNMERLAIGGAEQMLVTDGAAPMWVSANKIISKVVAMQSW